MPAPITGRDNFTPQDIIIIEHKYACILNYNTNKTKAMFSRLLRHPGMEMEWDYSGRMGRDGKHVDR